MNNKKIAGLIAGMLVMAPSLSHAYVSQITFYPEGTHGPALNSLENAADSEEAIGRLYDNSRKSQPPAVEVGGTFQMGTSTGTAPTPPRVPRTPEVAPPAPAAAADSGPSAAFKERQKKQKISKGWKTGALLGAGVGGLASFMAMGKALTLGAALGPIGLGCVMGALLGFVVVTAYIEKTS